VIFEVEKSPSQEGRRMTTYPQSRQFGDEVYAACKFAQGAQLRVDDVVDALDEKVAGLGVLAFGGRWSGVGVGGVPAGGDDERGGDFAVFLTADGWKEGGVSRGNWRDLDIFFLSCLESLINEGIGGIWHRGNIWVFKWHGRNLLGSTDDADFLDGVRERLRDALLDIDR
jgi:hypothetical protein